MKLRTQLVLAAGIVLFLPWAGYRYVLELDDSLRQRQSETLMTLAKSAAAIVRALPNADAAVESHSPSRVLFAQQIPAGTRVVMDGYSDDWPVSKNTLRTFYYGDNKSGPVTAGDASAAVVGVYTMQSPTTLYLFFQVTDNKAIFHNPQKHSIASGDHLLIRFPVDNKMRDYAISASAPGVTEARYWGRRIDGVRPILSERAIHGVWQDTTSGYNLELRLPLPQSGSKFGVAIADVDRNDAERRDILWTGTFDPRNKTDAGRLLFPDKSLQSALDGIVPQCGMLQVFDTNSWLLADIQGTCDRNADASIDSSDVSFVDSLLQRIFEYVLRPTDNGTSDFDVVNGRLVSANPNITTHAVYDAGNTLTAAYMLRDRPPSGVVLTSQDVNTAQSMSTQALVKLFSITVMAALIVSVSLLLYASLLSWRIRRLRNDTVSALDDRGDIALMVPSKAEDEIGELSRGLAEMLSRLRDYTDYQKSLASRLTHELRTPLTVTRTSLESIDSNKLPESNQQLLDRADSGVKQLSRILSDLSESTRIEQIVGDAEFETFDLVDFARAAVDAYRPIFPDYRFQLKAETESATIEGNAELLRQLLDKLIANAVSFSPTGNDIVIEVSGDEQNVELAVLNTGSTIPEIGVDLFSPMVSLRHSSVSEKKPAPAAPHLGLGLYIARLIAERHSGELTIRNDVIVDGVRAALSIARA